MESTVKERLLAFIQSKGLTKNKFEAMCGLGKRYVSNISRSISPDVIKRISLTFPELNMGWVMTGEGEMLKKETPEQTTDTTIISADAMKVFLNLSETLRSQQGTIAVLTDMASGRQDEMSALFTEMRDLLKKITPTL